ncbi:hypothetical protein HPP92_001263 [Vanilla planifolia]|uniref:Fungal lipase-like domain-containing protein n=1 Tax=Vanilla planifolia TaxID=51239 RepID=A0A835S310_VANPL|nr:hypothetical protein HPP92_001263 [Vanilla planifolia]
MGDAAVEDASFSSQMRTLRWVSMVLGLWNLLLVLIGGFLMLSASSSCSNGEKLPLGFVALIACFRIGCMAAMAKMQQATATTIVGHSMDGSITTNELESRFERQRSYRCWLWWTRFGMLINALQLLVSLYLMYIIAKGHEMKDTGWKKLLMVSFLVLLWLMAIIQCLTGSDVLRWRSFYMTSDKAWKAHYSEVFDHGIREALCCLGRVKYLSVLEEDEISSVAKLLGDLVAYRASGTGHLELLAGLVLLQSHKQCPRACNQLTEIPDARIQEGTLLHKFAEAAYTGPLLDFGRNPVLFPCSWLYRQGILTPWTHKRRPKLDGDNWWRGHAAAFLKCINLPPESLRRGRVFQNNREAAYFIVVLHDIRSIVIAVRGTETPEDLITDGLCRECNLSEDDLEGLINNGQLLSSVRETVLSSFPHYGHSGIVESARELYMQVDCQPGEITAVTSGFLSSLLGPGCECDGYKLRIVGHSLGGAVATFLGLRLKGRYPNLHVYAYGPLPCVDMVIAEACADFVTTIVYNDEFSSRLSVNSIRRIRSAAIQALSDNSSINSAVISNLACKILNVKKNHENEGNHGSPIQTPDASNDLIEDCSHLYQRRLLKHPIQDGYFQCSHESFKEACFPTNSNSNQYSSVVINGISSKCVGSMRNSCTLASQSSQPPEMHPSKQERCIERSPFDDPNSDVVSEAVYDNRLIYLTKDGFCPDHTTAELYEDNFNPTSLLGIQAYPVDDPRQSIGEMNEVFLAGLIIHIVPKRTDISPIWKFCIVNEEDGYKAYVASREDFKDIIISPYMFLDHLPWRCYYAMQRALETQESVVHHSNHQFSSEDNV